MKPWMIKTTSIHFYSEFRLKVCLKNHTHEQIHGIETNKSAYYPEAMCRSIAKHWRRVLLPDRWWRMLWTAMVPTTSGDHTLYAAQDGHSGQPQEDDDEEGDDAVPPSEDDKKKWAIQLHRLHQASGHPAPRNMVRMLVDAQVPSGRFKWLETSTARPVRSYVLAAQHQNKSLQHLCILHRPLGNV